MARPLGSQAVVVGAGMAGLAAAAALAPFFGKVLVLDADVLPAGDTPRMGAAQSAHVHQLLKGGEEALERLLPGFTAALYAAGGVPMCAGLDIDLIDSGGLLPRADAGFSVASLSRPVYERVLRDCVATLPSVDIRPGAAVARHSVIDGRCTGVELTTGETVAADLVVDASGASAALIEQLAADGLAAFDTEKLKINVTYATCRFAMPEAYRGEHKGFFVLPAAPDNHFGLLLPVENNEWIVSLGGRGADLPPRNLEGFIDYAAAFATPEIHARISDANPVGEPRIFRKMFAMRRRLDCASNWPDGLIVVGDGLSNVNPTYGQGMSVAALQAAELSAQLMRRAGGSRGLDGLAASFLPAAFEISGRAWSLAANSDYAYPETEGERPAAYPVSRAMAGALRKLCDTDEDFLIFRYRMAHMLETTDALRDGPLAIRFFTALQGVMAA
jgi:2-polyprenyl-6-methoxyphenol hydroxylase-like FAD-dependent oxidoreductase